MIEIFKALSEETRLRIFAQIIKGDMCVCEIEECLGLSQSNASRHLNTLKRAGILDSYKDAQWSYFKVSEAFIKDNRELYSYLVQEVKKLKSYESDSEKYNKYTSSHMCTYTENFKGNLNERK